MERAVLTRVLDSALSLTEADFGNVQPLDPASGALRTVPYSGFGSRFIDHFAVVRDDNSACGWAAVEQVQVVIAEWRRIRHRPCTAASPPRTRSVRTA